MRRPAKTVILQELAIEVEMPAAKLRKMVLISFLLWSGAAMAETDLSGQINAMMNGPDPSEEGAAPYQDPLHALGAPTSRLLRGEGDRMIPVDCPCDILWTTSGQAFSLSVLPDDEDAPDTNASRSVSSRTIINMMSGFRDQSPIVTTTAKGRGRMHVSLNTRHVLKIRAFGPWEVEIISRP